MTHSHHPVVLAGFDDHEAGRRALDRAIAETRARQGRLVVFMVAQMPLDPTDPRFFSTPADFDSMPRELHPPEFLEPVIASARERVHEAGVPVELRWAGGEPGASIVEAAEGLGAELIVVGHHHHSFLQKLVGQDVGGEVKAAAPCEVLVVD
jgi:nucleotide-binding universal stress UspA family protein